jgi:hypothetical protein
VAALAENTALLQAINIFLAGFLPGAQRAAIEQRWQGGAV